MTNDVFYYDYKTNQLWLVFTKDKMHSNNDVFQLRIPKGRGAVEDEGDTL